MIPELADCFNAFQQLELERTKVLAWLSEWRPECVTFRPLPDAWSAVEVLDHIVRVESGTIDGVRTGLQEPHALSSVDRPNVAALDRALRSDQSFQVPAGAGAIYPDAGTTLPDVASRWERARKELCRLLDGLTPADVHCGVFCHPFAGWMTFHEVLEHFSAHLYHHRFQLNRLRVRCGECPAYDEMQDQTK